MSIRRKFVIALLAANAAVLAPSLASAQDKSVTIIVPYSAGGSFDFTARVFAERLKDALGRTVIIENKAGGGGRIGLAALKGASGRNATVLFGASSLIINSIIFADSVGYDFRRDFVGVAQVGVAPMAMAVPYASKSANLREFLQEHAKDGIFSYGTNGPGSMSHLIGLKFAKAVGLKPEPIPYQGGAPMVNDLMAGQIGAATDTVADFAERHRANRIRVLATFSAERSHLLPDVPTASEQGVEGVDESIRFNIYASRQDDPAFTKAFAEALRKALEDPAVKSKLSNVMKVEFLDGTRVSENIHRDFETWTPLVDEFGLRQKR